MAVSYTHLEAFINNLGKYNEGFLVGEWVKFPVTNEEMQAVFKRIGIGRRYEEWFITDYDCPDAAIGLSLIHIFHIDRWIAILHKKQVQYQTPCAAVAVHKGVNTLKFQMKQRCTLNRVQFFL